MYSKIDGNFRRNIFYFSLLLKTRARIKHRSLVRFIFSWLSFSGTQNLVSSQGLYPFVYQSTSMRASARVISPLEHSHHKSQLSLLVLVNKPSQEQNSFCSGFATRNLLWETCPIKWCTNNGAEKIKDLHWPHCMNTGQNFKIHLLEKGEEGHWARN